MPSTAKVSLVAVVIKIGGTIDTTRGWYCVEYSKFEFQKKNHSNFKKKQEERKRTDAGWTFYFFLSSSSLFLLQPNPPIKMAN